MKENLPTRKNIRLKDYDYSKDGMYFITLCIKNRIELLDKITKESSIKLTKQGNIVENQIKKIEEIYKKVKIDEYIIMPNHLHMLIIIEDKEDVTVSRIIKQYKESITKKLGYSISQKSFYDHIIRDEREYYRIKQYIQNNIINWKKDCYF